MFKTVPGCVTTEHSSKPASAAVMTRQHRDTRHRRGSSIFQPVAKSRSIPKRLPAGRMSDCAGMIRQPAPIRPSRILSQSTTAVRFPTRQPTATALTIGFLWSKVCSDIAVQEERSQTRSGRRFAAILCRRTGVESGTGSVPDPCSGSIMTTHPEQLISRRAKIEAGDSNKRRESAESYLARTLWPGTIGATGAGDLESRLASLVQSGGDVRLPRAQFHTPVDDTRCRGCGDHPRCLTARRRKS